MQMITAISIDLYGETKYYLVSAKQGDKASRYVQATLMNNGVEFVIPSDAAVYANIKKPDGRFCYNECVVENNKVLVELTNQALAAAGTAYCDIEIRRNTDTEILSSAAFTIEIEASMRNENAILSCNEMTSLDNRIQNYINQILATEQHVIATENAFTVFHRAAEAAESDRAAAETARADAESARESAEATRRTTLTRYIGAITEAQRATENAIAATEMAAEVAQNSEQLSETLEQVEEMHADITNMHSGLYYNVVGGTPSSVDQMRVDGGTPFTHDEIMINCGQP